MTLMQVTIPHMDPLGTWESKASRFEFHNGTVVGDWRVKLVGAQE